MNIIGAADIGGTTLKLALFEEGGKLLKKWAVKTPEKEHADTLWQVMADSFLENLKDISATKDDLKAVGMGLPGPIRDDGFLPKMVNLGMGASYPADKLSAILNIPCAAGNDANVAALGEAKYGSAKGKENVVMLTLGTGVGGGVIVNGKIVAGGHGVGGEVGHFVVNPAETVACNCGNKGCLEQYASATGMVRLAKQALAESKEESSLRSYVDLTAKDICDEAKNGDRVALSVIDLFAKYLAIAVSHLVLTTDPDAVVIGGGVSAAGDLILNPVRKYTDDFTHIAESHGEIIQASLGNDAGIYGAAALAEALI